MEKVIVDRVVVNIEDIGAVREKKLHTYYQGNQKGVMVRVVYWGIRVKIYFKDFYFKRECFFRGNIFD